LPTAKQVQVYVVNSLTSCVIAVHDYAVTVVRNSFPGREFGCGQEQLSDQLGVTGLNIVNGPNALFWDDQNVRGRLRVDVSEGQNIFSFVYDIRRDFTVDDLEKQVV
jgi:hypothetical protein